MAVLTLDVQVTNDGVPIPGFPFFESFRVDDVFARLVTVASSTPSYTALPFVVPAPPFDETNARAYVLLMAPLDQSIKVRLEGQTAGGNEIPAGGVALWGKVRIKNIPYVLTTATTKILLILARINP